MKVEEKRLSPGRTWGEAGLSDRTAQVRDRVAEFQNGIQEKPSEKLGNLIPEAQRGLLKR